MFGLFQALAFYLSRKSRQWVAGRTEEFSQPFQFKAIYLIQCGSTADTEGRCSPEKQS